MDCEYSLLRKQLAKALHVEGLWEKIGAATKEELSEDNNGNLPSYDILT